MIGKDLAAHYDRLWKDSVEQIRSKGFAFDPLIDSADDHRFGITLLIRPSDKVLDSIQQFLEKVKGIDSDHHIYSNSDIHVTVMPIISCYDGFELEQINPREYIALIGECLRDIPCFDIQFRGITASPSCIMIKGFPLDRTLDRIRDRLREGFKTSALEQSLDKRYALQTAHSTVIRFKLPVKQPLKILAEISDYKDHDFGISSVAEMELVFNDWYQREKWVKVLAKFKL